MEILHALDMRLFGGGEIEIVNEIPKAYDHRRLPMAKQGAIISPVVNALYQQFEGDEFSIWTGDYHAHRNGSVRTRADMETIELSIAWLNKFAYHWKEIGNSDTRPLMFRISYAPDIDITTKFMKGFEYKTVDFHFSKEMFSRYAKDFDSMKDFLEKIENEKAATIDMEHKITLSMRSVIQSLMALDCKPVNCVRMMKNKAEDILMYALEATENVEPIKQKEISKGLKQKVFRAAKILDMSIITPPTVAQLAEMVESNARSLQIGFRQCFGESVYEYSRVRKLALAKELLLMTDETLNEIADKVGYNDGPYLINAFKKEFECTPDEFREDAKRKNH